jgi:acetyl esterase/lipase
MPPPAPRPTVTYANCTVAALEGFRPLHLDLHLPEGDGPFPVLLWVHGGGWHWGSRVWLPDTLAPHGFHHFFLDRGIAVADVDYRLASEAPWPAQLTDVRSAIRWLRHYATELNIDPDRFAALGESAGSHMACLAGLTGTDDLSLQAVISWYGSADFSWIPQDETQGGLAHLFGGALGTIPDFVASASPITHVHAGAPPFLHVHGTADTVVPYSEGVRLNDALVAAGASSSLITVEGAEHCFEGYDDIPGLLRQCADFLVDVMK